MSILGNAGGVQLANEGAYDVLLQKFTPAAASATAILNAKALTAAAQPGLSANLTQPDYARNLVVVGSTAGMTGNVVVYGTSKEGSKISETFALNGTTPVIGNKAFATVTSYDLPVQGAGGQTVSVGTGSKFGFAVRLTVNTVIFAYLNGTKEGTAPTVVTSATALESNTFTLNSAIPGAQEVRIYYVEV
jgi:hypothetical protein